MLETLNENPQPRIYPCAVRDTLQSLEAADAERLLEAISNDDKWSAWRLHKELAKAGLKVSDKAIKKHRECICSCRHLD